MTEFLLKGATIVNEGRTFLGSILIQDKIIKHVFEGALPDSLNLSNIKVVDCAGKYILPGVIDDQVHFREPGLTHKGTIASESKSAIAGGVTSFMEMPNVNPQTTTIENLEQKFNIASTESFANYSFYLGGTNENIDQLRALDKNNTCGVKVFMGSSTGNMLVDNPETLKSIFSEVKIPVATHCEDEATIQMQLAYYKTKFGLDIPISYHPKVRSREACLKSSTLAVSLAKKYGARLHVLHLSTADELALFESGDVKSKQITAEVCVHHLWFSSEDYEKHGAFIKWNPAVKNPNDREELFNAMLSDRIDVIATDHAPHTIEEKSGVYTNSASGGPLVQHSLLAMLDFYKQGKISLPFLVKKMCHAPADLFNVVNRGYIRKGYYADLAIVDMQESTNVTKDSLLYKCKWSPFEGHTFPAKIEKTIINGAIVYDNGTFSESKHAQSLTFSR